jgi:hypothetical protein
MRDEYFFWFSPRGRFIGVIGRSVLLEGLVRIIKGDLYMKITNHEAIKSGEQDLIDAITADLDWESIEDIFSQEHKLKIEDHVEYKKGDIIVYNDQIAYKLEFDVNIVLSVLLDREGNYLAVTSSGNLAESPDSSPADASDEPKKTEEEAEESGESTIPEVDEPIAAANGDVSASSTNPGDGHDKIAELASQAGEMISKLDDEAQVVADVE